MQIYLEKAIFLNRAPFKEIKLDFSINQIAVLSGVNGTGKTTILSHLVDAFYEMAKKYYNDIVMDRNDYYRLSTDLFNFDMNEPSIVYFRFRTIEDNFIDYVDIRKDCTKEFYDNNISLPNKIDFDSQLKNDLQQGKNVKRVSPSFTKDIALKVFENNIITYFPSYRFEIPGYLNDLDKLKLNFNIESKLAGNLNKPIEVVSGLSSLANWVMDIVLDMRYMEKPVTLKQNLDTIISLSLLSKEHKAVRFGIGPRNFGSTRIQIVDITTNEQVYPSIFNLSSGESAIFCLFGEILRQADINKNNIDLQEITGIVLVDEIDKHLHIKLQKEILPILFQLFPNVQFFLSSHSPFFTMGLADIVQTRTKIIDVKEGLSIQPINDPLYQEVYELMIGENQKYKQMYQSINDQIEKTKVLQIVTEGKNTEHIEKAIQLIDKKLIDQLKIISGAENRSGDQQLKNAFEIMSKGEHLEKFLFVWDCDSKEKCDTLTETNNFFKFAFLKNESNTIAKKGIENLYSEDFFTEDVYDTKVIDTEYGGSKTEKLFNKSRFLNKIIKVEDPNVFNNFYPLIEKINSILTSIPPS